MHRKSCSWEGEKLLVKIQPAGSRAKGLSPEGSTVCSARFLHQPNPSTLPAARPITFVHNIVLITGV